MPPIKGGIFYEEKGEGKNNMASTRALSSSQFIPKE